MSFDIEPSLAYNSSGKIKLHSMFFYMLFVILAAVFSQLLIGAGAMIGNWMLPENNGGNAQNWIFLIGGLAFIGGGYWVAGFIVVKWMNLASRLGCSRNRILPRIFVYLTVPIAAVARYFVVNFNAENSPFIGKMLSYIVPLTDGYGVAEVIIGAIIMIVSGTIGAILLHPYCEECGKYMIEKNYYFKLEDTNTLLGILRKIKTERLPEHIEFGDLSKVENGLNRSCQIEFFYCPQCSSSYLATARNEPIKNEKGENEDNAQLIFNDTYDTESGKLMVNALNGLN